LSDLAIFLVHEPNGNLSTPNNPSAVDYFCRIYVAVLPVATPTKTNEVIYLISILYIVAFQFSSFVMS